MILKRGGDDGELGAFKKLWHLKWNKDHDQKDFDPFIDPNDNGGNDGAMEEEVEECVEKDPTNLEIYWEARLPNAPKSLEGCDVKLSFQFKMLDFMSLWIKN